MKKALLKYLFALACVLAMLCLTFGCKLLSYPIAWGVSKYWAEHDDPTHTTATNKLSSPKDK